MCVSVSFSKLHEHSCPYCFSCWYEGLFTNNGDVVHCCTKFHVCHVYMSMLVPIVLVVGTKDCLQTNYGDVVHCCTKFHVCQLFISTWKT